MGFDRDICIDKTIQNESVPKGCGSGVVPVNEEAVSGGSVEAGRDYRVGPLFSFKIGQLLTRLRLVSAVQEALEVAGVDGTEISGHSFWIGAATEAAKQGSTDSEIKDLGYLPEVVVILQGRGYLPLAKPNLGWLRGEELQDCHHTTATRVRLLLVSQGKL